MVEILFSAQLIRYRNILSYLSLVWSPELFLQVKFDRGNLVEIWDAVVKFSVVVNHKGKPKVELIRFLAADFELEFVVVPPVVGPLQNFDIDVLFVVDSMKSHLGVEDKNCKHPNRKEEANNRARLLSASTSMPRDPLLKKIEAIQWTASFLNHFDHLITEALILS